MKFEFKEKDGTLEARVTVEKRTNAADPKTRLDIIAVRKLIEERYPKYKEKIANAMPEESTSHISSEGADNLTGLFKFALKSAVQKKKITKTQTKQKK